MTYRHRQQQKSRKIEYIEKDSSATQTYNIEKKYKVEIKFTEW